MALFRQAIRIENRRVSGAETGHSPHPIPSGGNDPNHEIQEYSRHHPGAVSKPAHGRICRLQDRGASAGFRPIPGRDQERRIRLHRADGLPGSFAG